MLPGITQDATGRRGITQEKVLLKTAFNVPSPPQGVLSGSLPLPQGSQGTLASNLYDMWNWPFCPWLVAKEKSGRDRMEGREEVSRPASGRRCLGEALKYHHSAYGIKATQIEKCPITGIST